jgi:hypothetical protein
MISVLHARHYGAKILLSDCNFCYFITKPDNYACKVLLRCSFRCANELCSKMDFCILVHVSVGFDDIEQYSIFDCIKSFLLTSFF